MKTRCERVRILCIDDERNVLRCIRRMFLDDDIEVITAGSGEEGLKALAEVSPIHLVISDYRMPGMDGVDFLKQVYDRWPETIRIVLSGYADIASIVEAVNKGHIYQFIPKPWNEDELRFAISNALDTYFLQKKNVELTKDLKKVNDELRVINQNLESMVEERTLEIQFQNKVLKMSQNILDALPVGVVGMDSEELVVQCNQKAKGILFDGEEYYFGMNRRSFLPEEINAVIDRVLIEGEISGSTVIHGTQIHYIGNVKTYENNQDVVLLVLFPYGGGMDV